MPISLRRESFELSTFRETIGRDVAGMFGEDLGLLMTCFLGFQTIGSVYGKIMNDLLRSDLLQGILARVLFTFSPGAISYFRS